ncbi:hypothetical protein CHRYSEOSP005_00020 [Chryseobacterium sp. Alg-005]|uniref:hypothetical protein n=1 Tax=Chryseobacterium sp. Alg-005 TaxID=3159516 RepID=UPI0035558F43
MPDYYFIDAKALRVENLVTYNGSVFKLKKISKYKVTADRGKGDVEFDIGDLSPLKITEYWLKRLNFEFDEFEKPKIKVPSELGYAKFELSENGIFLIDGDQSTIGKELRFVHEVQNLFFALTGEEMKISE